MKHLNDNLLCAIDIETSGLIAGYHEILQIAVIPLGNDFEWNKHMQFFDHILRPDFVERVDVEAVKTLRRQDTSLDYDQVIISREKIAKYCSEGISQDRAIDSFLNWFERLHLKPKKRIIPIGHNLAFDMPFIKAWLGPESFDLVFDPRWRDTMGVSLFWNDVDAYRQDRCTFKDAKLSSVCTSMRVENMMAHNAFDDALATARCYGRMVKQFNLTAKIPEPEDLPVVNSKESRSHEKAQDKWLASLAKADKQKVIDEYLESLKESKSE
jgi:DNA polymerase III alpha subunit (gram-positive type)